MLVLRGSLMVFAVAVAVIAAVAIGAVLAAAAAFGLRLRVGDAGGDGEKADGGGRDAGFEVQVGLPFALILAPAWQGKRPAAFLLLRMTCKKVGLR